MFFVDSKNEDWSPGRLLHYGRAELKQSDHRPVIATIEIEVCKIDVDRRSKVFYEVIKDLGPPDATIIIQCDADTESGFDSQATIFDDNLMMALLQDLVQIGQVILVRFVADTMWATFRDGQCALAAAAKQTVKVLGYDLLISLKTPNWVQQSKQELELCSNNTVALYEPEYNCLGIPIMHGSRVGGPLQSSPARPVPPSRPPLPTSSPAKQKSPPVRMAGVISIPSNQEVPSTVALGCEPPMQSEALTSPPTPSLTPTSAPLVSDPVMQIYEVIDDDGLTEPSCPEPREPPPPPPRPESSLPPLPQRLPGSPFRTPPPIPARSAPPPPLPARPR